MKKYIALLRGINVSGQKKIPMVELRACLKDSGFENIETYIQSGNVIFESDNSDVKILADKMQEAIKNTFGFEVPVLVIGQNVYQEIISSNPFLGKSEDTKPLYAGFLFDSPQNDRVTELKNSDTGNDKYIISESHIFMKYAEGIGKSKMDNNFFEKKLKVRMTTRNWNTIMKLASS
jgi:uncharacterized protein (DUF1697 family)